MARMLQARTDKNRGAARSGGVDLWLCLAQRGSSMVERILSNPGRGMRADRQRDQPQHRFYRAAAVRYESRTGPAPGRGKSPVSKILYRPFLLSRKARARQNQIVGDVQEYARSRNRGGGNQRGDYGYSPGRPRGPADLERYRNRPDHSPDPVRQHAP